MNFTALEESKKQDTYDEEVRVRSLRCDAQAGEQEIDLFQMKEGETVTFVANASDQAARATQTVTITKVRYIVIRIMIWVLM